MSVMPQTERIEFGMDQGSGSVDIALDWESLFNSEETTQEVKVDNISDGLVKSLTTLGCVDIEYIASITGEEYQAVIGNLKGSIYQNPDTWEGSVLKGWETADEYLSGNLLRKLKAAKDANKEYEGYFRENIKAIEGILPQSAGAEEIYVTLGSPWVPADIIDEFIQHLLGEPYGHMPWMSRYKRRKLMEESKTIHDKETGTWELPHKNRYKKSVASSKTYGTDRMEALAIIEKTLNMKTIAVTDEVLCSQNASGKKRVINKGETVAAIEKQQKIIQAFQEWVWEDAGRKKRLEAIFGESFGSVRRRVFDGSFLEFPGMSPDVELFPYQKDAVARIIFTPNTLLAHDVGAGKTYVMVAAGMELHRMGLSTKNLYVVPNNIVGQWEKIFKELYPNANLLCIDPKAFVPQKRKAVLRDLRDNDYDGIIMAYSCFEQIPLSKDFYLEAMREKEAELLSITGKNGKVPTKRKKKYKKLENAKKELEERVQTINDVYDGICFDNLGITRLFIDEAHNFKNVPIDSKIFGVRGISSKGSKHCRDMMDKVHMLQKKNGGKGVVMATGTPITNSVTDVYIMQQYLQSGELGMLDLQSFDAWVGMFAEQVTEFEIDVDTSTYKLATRFAKFHNLPELTSMIASIADFHQAQDSSDVPSFDGYTDEIVGKTDELALYLNEISERADSVRNGDVKRKEDNLLKITTDGRKAALDLRLVKPETPFTEKSKVAACADTVAGIYFKTLEDRSTQLIFCDTSTPKAGFNMYTELKRILVGRAVPAEEIAFIHDATTEKAKLKLFKAVREGNIRVLIGSTFKLGLGVNVQDRLIALHHLDIPWRPADMTQREGRILRQGNKNEKVYIYRYITEGSFDAYSWQLLETKQRFIAGLLSGSWTERSGGDIEDTILDYAEVKALAIGNPLLKKRVEVANELARYTALQKKLTESRIKLEKELLEIPEKIEKQKKYIKWCELDIAMYEEWLKENPAPTSTAEKKEEAERRKTLRMLFDEAIKNNYLATREKNLMIYKGFDIVLPANMTCDEQYVWVRGYGKYYVELGDTMVGNLIRIDNRLDTLNEHLRDLRKGLKGIKERAKDIELELAKNEGYGDQIEDYKKQLEDIDIELGVGRNE